MMPGFIAGALRFRKHRHRETSVLLLTIHKLFAWLYPEQRNKLPVDSDTHLFLCPFLILFLGTLSLSIKQWP